MSEKTVKTIDQEPAAVTYKGRTITYASATGKVYVAGKELSHVKSILIKGTPEGVTVEMEVVDV